MIAALYIDPRGPYPKLGVDCWDVTRDAREYLGPHPIVAHPPCGPWGRLKHLYRGNEHNCALFAVDQVRAYGGVLEHPAHSTLWKYCLLPKPDEPADKYGGYTVEVYQCDWGHVARKHTWLYLVGVPRSALVTRPTREPTHWISGGGNGRGKPPPEIKVCSAQQRRRTPIAFAQYLISLAEAVQR